MRVKDFASTKEDLKTQPRSARTVRFDVVTELPAELDAFIKECRARLPAIDVLVSGVYGNPPKKTSLDRYFESEKVSNQSKTPWLTLDGENIRRKYTIGFVVQRITFGLDEFLRNLANEKDKPPSDFYDAVIRPASAFVEKKFDELIPKRESIGNLRVGLLHGLEGDRYRIWIDITIRTSFGEFIRDVGRFDLTAVGMQFADTVGKYLRNWTHDEDDLRLFVFNARVKKKVIRELENRARVENGFHKIGDGNVSETLLATLVAEVYPSAEREKIFPWLGLQRLDVYVPELRVGIEYNGEQHYESISVFGGEEKLMKQKQMDLVKRGLCFQNGITLVEWPYWEKVERRKVVALLEQIGARVMQENRDDESFVFGHINVIFPSTSADS